MMDIELPLKDADKCREIAKRRRNCALVEHRKKSLRAGERKQDAWRALIIQEQANATPENHWK
jgi:hypothetical protein